MRLGRQLIGLIVAAASAWTFTCAFADEQLSLGAKHWAPTIFKQSGTGTSNAMAEAKVTRAEIEGWCANWTPDDKGCVQRELASEMAKQIYRASADCTHGRITAVDGNTYSLAGTWDNSDIGGGRTRWRDKSGRIVGRDNASGGLGISQQWEVLCPGPLRAAPASASRPPSSSSPPAASGAPAFTVGQAIEAKYGREWVRGRVNRIVQTAGAKGPELAYDVQLVNGKRGVLPARMLRPAPGG
jgi:hypothetical protein